MSFRQGMLRAHRRLTLGLGILFLLMGTTGALLVFGTEIDRALNPQLFRITPGPDVGLDRVREAAERAVPDRPVVRVATPALPASGGVYQVRLAGEPATEVHIDPGTGVVLGARREGMSLISGLRAVHTNLASGAVGTRLVGLVGIFWLVAVATGIALWGTGRRSLTIRRGRGRFSFLYDLHGSLGLIATPLLILIPLTGVALAFDTLADSVIYGVFQSEPPPAPPRTSGSRGPLSGPIRLPLDDLCRLAEAEVPGASTVTVALPLRAGDPVVFRLKYPDSDQPNGRCYVHLDPRDGQPVWVQDERRLNLAGRVRLNWIYPLHIGQYGGLPTRTLHVLAGLTPSVLLGTGLIIWYPRARSRRRANRPRSAPPGSPGPGPLDARGGAEGPEAGSS